MINGVVAKQLSVFSCSSPGLAPGQCDWFYLFVCLFIWAPSTSRDPAKDTEWAQDIPRTSNGHTCLCALVAAAGCGKSFCYLWMKVCSWYGWLPWHLGKLLPSYIWQKVHLKLGDIPFPCWGLVQGSLGACSREELEPHSPPTTSDSTPLSTGTLPVSSYLFLDIHVSLQAVGSVAK